MGSAAIHKDDHFSSRIDCDVLEGELHKATILNELCPLG